MSQKAEVKEELEEENSTCSGPGEFCCEAPGGDVRNCPDSARTSNCDSIKSCCCGFADVLKQEVEEKKEEKKQELEEENSTCSGPGEFCCGAPGGDVRNCPDSARTSNCDSIKSCCCGFADFLSQKVEEKKEELEEENSTCSGPGEFCCEAPGGDVHNCPDSARTSNCDSIKSCCCGFAQKFIV